MIKKNDAIDCKSESKKDNLKLKASFTIVYIFGIMHNRDMYNC